MPVLDFNAAMFEDQTPSDLPPRNLLVLQFSVTTDKSETPAFTEDRSNPRFIGRLEAEGVSLPVLKRNGRAIDVVVAADAVAVLRDGADDLSQKELDFDFSAKMAARLGGRTIFRLGDLRP